MIKKLFVFCLGLCLTFFSIQMKSQTAEEQISENITKIIEALELIPQLEQDQVRDYLLLICDSIILVAPQVDVPQSIQTEMKDMREAYIKEEAVILQEKSVKPLWDAARFINPDFDLNFPENPTPDLIKEDVRLELHQALSFLDQGKMDRVEEILIRTLLRIVTPHKH